MFINLLYIIKINMSQTINENTMTQICKYGKYYNPASNHYNNLSNVSCDRCYRENLNACIGYKNNDLCLKCANEINEIENLNKMFNNKQFEFSVNRLRLSGEPITKMRINQFKLCQPTQIRQINTLNRTPIKTLYINYNQYLSKFMEQKIQYSTSNLLKFIKKIIKK